MYIEMEVVGTRGCHTYHQKYFILVILFLVSVALGQESPRVIFQYTSPQTTVSLPRADVESRKGHHIPILESGSGNKAISIPTLEADNNLTFLGIDFRSTDDGLVFTPCKSSQTNTVSGRCLYKNPVHLIENNSVKSFSTWFQVTVCTGVHTEGNPYPGTLQGLEFIITNTDSEQGDPRFAVNVSFVDGSVAGGLHVEARSNSNVVGAVQILADAELLHPQEICNNISVWIEYTGMSETLDMYVNNSNVGRLAWPGKPQIPSSRTQVKLIDVLSQDAMFVGFSASVVDVLNSSFNDRIGGSPGYYISEWTFNSDGPPPDLRRDSDGTAVDYVGSGHSSRKIQKGTIILVVTTTVPSGLIFVSLMCIIVPLRRRNSRLKALANKYKIDPEELERLDRGPQTFKRKVLFKATKGFSSSELLGSGGFGSVYKGKLRLDNRTSNQTDVAVKRISASSSQGTQEFLAEIKVIGQAQHRNLVRLLGWCHDEGELLLVYEYMPNGSVDQHLFKKNGSEGAAGQPGLTWSRRLKIVSGVATALAFLHEEWEQRVIHRDVKSSNVMLDGEFNARLGDFGLARLSEHNQEPRSTAVLAGTWGYFSPELFLTRKATEKTDVYSFGVVVLEMATGRRPLLPSENQPDESLLVVDLVWDLYKAGNLLEAADCSLEGAYDPREMVTLLKIGLLCCHPNPDQRPNMRLFLQIWKGSTPFPHLPYVKPVPVVVWDLASDVSDTDANDTTITIETPLEALGDSVSSAFVGDGDTTPINLRMDDNRGVSSNARSGELGQSRGSRRSFPSPAKLRSRHWESTPLPM